MVLKVLMLVVAVTGVVQGAQLEPARVRRTPCCSGGPHIPRHFARLEDYVARGDWNWSEINTEESMSLPRGFLMGAATAEYQNSGAGICTASNWAAHLPKMPTKIRAEHAGTAADWWNKCVEDIALVKALKLNALRFSIDWSMIEPTPGDYNIAALEHYDRFINALLENHITPMVTLHHFVHPQWFEALGGFENEENIEHFVRFSRLVFERYHNRVRLWCTFNEPNIFAFSAYVRGEYPPGVRDSLRAGHVLKNLWIAHYRTYHALKPINRDAQIGVVHQHLIFEPVHVTSGAERAVTDYLTQLITTASFNFMCTDHFIFRSKTVFDMMFGAKRLQRGEQVIDFELPGLQDSYDFVGLNYYSRVRLNFRKPHQNPYFDPSDPDEITTDMPYAFYPEGLYNAIVDMSVCRKPIYITENGIADASDTKRATWIKRYLHAVRCALHDGYDVRGYIYWSLLNNIEWNDGIGMCFGLHDIKFDHPDKVRTVYPGARELTRAIERAVWLDAEAGAGESKDGSA